MQRHLATTLGPRWWSWGLKSSLELNNNAKSRIWDWHKKRSSWILRVPRSSSLKNSPTLGINTCEITKLRLLNLSSSWKSSRSRSWCYMRRRSPKHSSSSRVIARILLRCASRKRYSSLSKTTIRQTLCATWLRSRSSLRPKLWMRIFKWLWFVKWKSYDRSISRVCRHSSRGFREIVKNKLSIDKLIHRDWFSETKTCYKTFLKSRP